MDRNSELDCYLYYMWNRWDYSECRITFGRHLVDHIWSKWLSLCESDGRTGAAASIYALLDGEQRKKLVERAVRHYNK